MPPSLLGEFGRGRTSVDYLVEDDGLAVCIEGKWTERGIGTCSCSRYGGKPAVGKCREVIREKRPKYWEVALEIFGLPARQDGNPCPLSPVYQAVRSVAAALALSEPDGIGVFALVYDVCNPYFGGCGEWQGWPVVLRDVLDGAHDRLRFRAISWQELMPLLPVDNAVGMWAREKHGLG